MPRGKLFPSQALGEDIEVAAARIEERLSCASNLGDDVVVVRVV